MKKILSLILFCLLHTVVFSQTPPKGEPKDFYNEYKKEMDSLSKLSGKVVTGYLLTTSGNKKQLTIFYIENDSLKSMILDTTSRQSPYRGTKRTVDSVSKVLHR